jgi:hypothetical protein
MKKIVERYGMADDRQTVEYYLASEVDAEIERLKAESAMWESRTKDGAEIIMGNVQQIERLRGLMVGSAQVNEDMRAEIKQLRAFLRDVEAASKDGVDYAGISYIVRMALWENPNGTRTEQTDPEDPKAS